MKTLSRVYVALILIFLYAPVAVMVLFSFNSGGSVWVFEGFSLDWYKGLATNTAMLEALKHTLIIAVLSALISTVMGTAASVGILALRKRVSRNAVMSITNIPMMNADIVTGKLPTLKEEFSAMSQYALFLSPFSQIEVVAVERHFKERFEVFKEIAKKV